jgi:hypothetical protein
MKILIIHAVMTVMTLAQSVHEVPFASGENMFELAVETSPGTTVSSMMLKVLQAPEWLHLHSREQFLGRISDGQVAVTRLTFSIDKSAPINRPEPFEFAIIDGSGQRWNKEIRLSVAPPMEFALFQNYPNPFNPTTTVGYQLAAESKVRLSVYDLLGREVSILTNGIRSAGFHQETLGASSYSSGIYILRMVATSQDGREVLKQRTITVLK